MTHQDGLKGIVLDYYKLLFVATYDTLAIVHAEDTLLELIPSSFKTQCLLHLLAALSRSPDGKEICKTLRDMASGKSPDPNGVLTEFYVKFWDLIGADFTEMIREAIVQGSILSGLNHGVIIQLPKEVDLELISHWRLITLLNTSYEIMAKVLQMRLQKLLQDVIHRPVRFPAIASHLEVYHDPTQDHCVGQ